MTVWLESHVERGLSLCCLPSLFIWLLDSSVMLLVYNASLQLSKFIWLNKLKVVQDGGMEDWSPAWNFLFCIFQCL